MKINLLYRQTCEKLGKMENHVFIASQLLMSELHCKNTDLLISQDEVKEETYIRIETQIKKLQAGMPLQYVLGEWDFYGESFFVGEGVLIPRPETECLIELICKKYPKKANVKIIDLCSGSGCIAITLSRFFPNAKVFALEKSEDACFYLEKNIAKHNANVTLIKDDVLAPKTNEKNFDIIVSNPPYLSKEDMQTLQKQVTFEPQMALFGNDDGLMFYREITKIWKNRQNIGGEIFYEIGINQQNDVTEILQENGYINICQTVDLCGIIRDISAQVK